MELWRRLTSWKSTVEGIVAPALVYLAQSRGVDLTTRQGRIAWAASLAILVVKVLTKDEKRSTGKPGPNGGVSTMPPSWKAPDSDSPTIRSPHSLRTGGTGGAGLRPVVVLLICSSLLLQSACAEKTTLDRIGALVVAGAGAFKVEVNALCNSGTLDSAKCNLLRSKIPQVSIRSQQFARLLSAFGEITPDNVSGLLRQFSEMTSFLQGLLVDSGLAPDSKLIRIIHYVEQALIAASVAVSAIHPPAVVSANRNRGIVRPNPKPATVEVNLPRPDGDVQKALEAAGKRAIGPSLYRKQTDPLRTQVVFN